MQLNFPLVDQKTSIKETMRIINKGRLGIAFILDENDKLFGLVTDGDIRRAILKGINIEQPIEKITNRNPIIFHSATLKKELSELKTNTEIIRKIPLYGSLKIPVVDNKGKIENIIFVYPNGRCVSLKSKSKFSIRNEDVKKVLVIGGAGYLGSVLCRKLLEKKFKVKVLDNLAYSDEGIKKLYRNKNFEFLKGDIRNISALVDAIKNVDAVIHLAAIVGDPACVLDPEETLEINCLATKTITEVCKYFQINRFVFASTCSVYGESPNPDVKLTEVSLLAPVSLYAETKIKCEQSILDAMDENFSPTILRMATLYGYSFNMRFDLVVNLLTAKAIFDKKITVFGGHQWRPLLHLNDAAQAYINCLEAPLEKVRGEIFNVLSENYKMIEIGKIINSICPTAKLEINEKILDKRSYNVSFKKISRILGYQPRKKIQEGIMEVKTSIEKGLVKNYRNPKYYRAILSS